MPYAAIALALTGFLLGVIFRFRVLLPILLALLFGSIVFSLGRGAGLLGVIWTVVMAQAIIQASYFLGLVARSLFGTRGHTRRVL